MKKILRIKRQKGRGAEPYWQEFEYESDDESVSVATALMSLPVRWEHSCLQKRCGACAMVIDGRPSLACDRRLFELSSELVVIEPLRKFPVIEDLLVDRQSIMDTLKKRSVWLTDDSDLRSEDTVFEAAGCLNCGLCLEVCPNFNIEGSFGGMSLMSSMVRLMAEAKDEQIKALKKDYEKGVYAGCGKSLACRDICPAGLDMEKLLIKGNFAGRRHIL